jgi:uncharacterized RDD family membrane protein YckC
MPPPPGAGGWQPQPGRPTGPSGPRAQFWPRLAGLLIDAVILGVANQIIGVIVGESLGIVVGLAVSIGYHVYFISSPSGQTPGMRALSIRAIDQLTGGQIAPGKAVVRWLMSIVSGFVCLVGYLWMLWDPEKQTWHDKVAGTYVVPTSYFPVTSWPG